MSRRRKADAALGPRFDVYHATPATASSRSRSRGGGSSTAGTAATGASDSLFVCSLIENRAFEVGIAAIDLKSNSMMLTQLGDSQNYSATLAMMEM